jgi:hypothetical protein
MQHRELLLGARDRAVDRIGFMLKLTQAARFDSERLPFNSVG